MEANRMNTKSGLTIWTALTLMICGGAFADEPPTSTSTTAFTYWGELYFDGEPFNGIADIDFVLYGSADGTEPLADLLVVEGMEIHDGLFIVDIDFGIPVFTRQPRWLEITVNGATLEPRQRLSPKLSHDPIDDELIEDVVGSEMLEPSVHQADGLTGTQAAPSGSALRTGSLAKISGADGDAATQWQPPGVVHEGSPDELPDDPDGNDEYSEPMQSSDGWKLNGSNIFYNTGNVAIGASNSSNARLRVREGGTNFGIFSEHTATSGQRRAVFGRTESSRGTGVYGWARNNANDRNWGVYGRAEGGKGRGVEGRADGETGRGVFADARATEGVNYGLYARTFSDEGFAGYFQGGRSYFEGSVGIGTSNPAFKLQVEIEEDASGAILGIADGLATTAVFGQAFGGFSTGVIGSAGGIGSIGVRALGSAGGAAAFEAVQGGANYAGSFSGDVIITGTLSKGGGSFKIDHPLYPESKYLVHSFVESPDMMNIYNGNVTTNESGEVWVELPEYFEALNTDFRYQLTVIGQFAQAIVGEEIRDGRFSIKTDQPFVKVSWQVTGVRHDPWAEANRIEVEVDKPEGERGRYLHPEAYGKPADLAANSRRQHVPQTTHEEGGRQ
jgi:hypothetical protein